MDPNRLHNISISECGDRFPQWSIQETRDLLMIRAELDSTFMETKRNKLLWEVISTKINERGYNRSAEQCKSKWKNLVTRYKGCEMMEQEGTRQHVPFYNELQDIFTNRMQRLLWTEAEGMPSGSGKRGMNFPLDDEDNNDGKDVEKKSGNSTKKKKKAIDGTSSTRSNVPNNTHMSMTINLKETLEKFMKQQMQTEMLLMRMYEAKQEERRAKNIEWRQKLEALERERVRIDERCKKREEKRRVREEARAEKMDALIIALLDKLR